MAKQTFTTGQVLTAAQMTSLQQTAMGGGSATAKTANYVLVAADAGGTVAMNAAGATTITVNTSLFAAGDTVLIQNLGAGVCTITAGTATVNTAGSLALVQYESGILYFTATGTAIFNDYVQASGGAATVVGCQVYKTGAAQTLANGTGTAVTFNAESFDTDAFHSTATNTDRLTVPAGKAGYYLFFASIMFDSNSSGQRVTTLQKNGTGLTGYAQTRSSSGSGGYMTCNALAVLNLAVADYVSITGFQNSGGDLDIMNDGNVMSLTYLGV